MPHTCKRAHVSRVQVTIDSEDLWDTPTSTPTPTGDLDAEDLWDRRGALRVHMHCDTFNGKGKG